MNKFAADLGTMLVKRQVGRAGRLTKTKENMSRELREAGDTKPSKRTFSYPKGCKMAELMKDILNIRSTNG